MIRPIAWNALAVLASAAAPAAIMVAIARHLPPAEVGTYSLLTWGAGLGATVVAAGTPLAVTRYAATHTRDATFLPALLRRLARSLGPPALLASLAAVAIFAWLDRAEGISGAACAALAIAPLGATALAQAAYRGEQRFAALAVRQIVVSLASVTLVGVALALHAGRTGLLAAFLAQALLAAGILGRGLRVPAAPSLTDAAWARFRTLSRGLFVLAILDQVVWQRSEVLFLRAFRSPSEIAFYTLPVTLVAALFLVPASIAGVLLPRLAGALDPRAMSRAYYADGMRLLAFTALPLAAVAVVLAPAALHALSGGAYAASVPVFRVLCITAALTTITAAGAAVLITEEETGFMVRWGLIAAAVNLLLDVVLIPRGGALGAACANGVAQSLAVGATGMHLVRVRGLRVPWASLARLGVAAGLAAGAAALVLTWAPVSPGVSLAGAVAAAAVMHVGGATLLGELPGRSRWWHTPAEPG